MSLQVCSCGWSKVTTYQGLRTHQGKKGCTPKGLRIPESEQFRFNRFVPMVTYLGPPISLTDPFMDFLKSSTKSGPQMTSLAALFQAERVPLPVSPPPVAGEDETPPANAGAPYTAKVQLFGQAPPVFSETQIFCNQSNLVNTVVNAGLSNLKLYQNPTQVFGAAARASTFSFDLQQNVSPSPSTPTCPPEIPVAREAETPRMTQTFADALKIGSTSAADAVARDTASVPLFGQTPSMFSGTPVFGSQTNPTNTEVNAMLPNQTFFQTPTQGFGLAAGASTFPFGAQQNVFPYTSTPTCPPEIPVAREAETPHMTQTFADALKIGSTSAADAVARDTASVPLFGQTPSMFSGTPVFGSQTNPTNREVNKTLPNQTFFQTPTQGFGLAAGASTFPFGAQQNVFPNTSTPTSPPEIPVARKAETPRMTQTFTNSLKTGSHSNRDSGTHNTASAAQSSSTVSVTKISNNQTTPANKEVKTETSNQTCTQNFFETPQKVTGTTARACRALDFSTGAQQLESWDIPTTTAQETFIRLKKKEIDRAKAKRDKIRADLQTRVQKIERKMDQIKASELDCKCSLDAEWLEISNVFSDVLRVVEEARRKALKPLEERSKKLEKEAQVLVQKFQKEINELKKSMDELDQNQDLEVSPPTCLDQPQTWKNVTLDTSFSFGSLRATTLKMVERIETRLEKLSSTELKRTPKFAVDVKLDPTSAHPCLDVSPDRKTVGYGEKALIVPNCPERFDKFGSILGINRLTSGKSYWEVEVKNKSGWDLGVARSDVIRKGKLSVNTSKGFWVIVHYEDKKYAALKVPPVSLALTQKPQKVGVFVDYEEGLISFYDVTAKAHIYSFTECSFSGVVLPYFSPHLKQNEKNSAPLIISAVNTQQ